MDEKERDKEIISVELPNTMIKSMDNNIIIRDYTSRSEYIRQAIRFLNAHTSATYGNDIIQPILDKLYPRNGTKPK